MADKLLVKRPVLAESISQSERTISTLQKARLIPYVRVRGSVLFDPVEVVAELKRTGRIAPVGELTLRPPRKRRATRISK